MIARAVWFRNDLRVDDHPALSAACSDSDAKVLAVCVIAKRQWQMHQVGSNAQALYFSALTHLTKQLAKLGIELTIISIDTWLDIPDVLVKWVEQHSVGELHFNLEVGFDERQRDQSVFHALRTVCNVVRHRPDMLCEPWRLVNQQGSAFKVFTPFSKRVIASIEKESLDIVSLPIRPSMQRVDPSNTLQDLERIKVESDLAIPDVSAEAIAKQIKAFFEQDLADYSQNRDFPAIEGTSRLSPALAVGAISVRRLYQEARAYSIEAATKWTRELIWRDFYRYIMWHYPHVSKGFAFRRELEPHIQWNDDLDQFKRWCDGQTGVPIVDAAMRQFNQTGWMHNRLRMVVASFLTKNLWIDWRKGERYFATKLFDYDFASNNGGWQWSASVGTDAAPYFRVFSPTSQAARFDPNAEFIRKWIKELSDLSAQHIHRYETHRLPNYPEPLVDLKLTRKLAIEQFKQAMIRASLKAGNK
jgi:deoxyribodipyrimidine photo-lyase